jgi:hypothetical protein
VLGFGLKPSDMFAFVAVLFLNFSLTINLKRSLSMVSKKVSSGSKQVGTPIGQSVGIRDWGGNVKTARVQSGAKLKLAQDCDCILRFLGAKDISQYTGSDESIYYLMFSDGKTVVSMPQGFAFSEISWTAGKYYYIHNAAEIELPGKNAMKDYEVIELGIQGDIVDCPKRISETGKLSLSDDAIKDINYTRLNYPLRG